MNILYKIIIMIVESIDQLNENIIKHRKQAEDLLMVLKERSIIDEIYSKDLERIAESMPDSFYPEIVDYFKRLTLSISHKTAEFSKSLSGIIDNFKATLVTQAISIKDHYIEGTKNEQRKDRLYRKVNDARLKYWKCCEECEKIAFSLDNEPSVSKKEKLVQKLLSLKSSMDTHYKSYIESLERYSKYEKTNILKAKKAVNIYNQQEQQLLDGYFYLQKSFLKIHSESLMDLSEFSNISSIQNSSKDISKLVNYQECYFEAYEGTHPLFKNLGINSAPHLHASIIEASGVSKGTETAINDMYRTEIGSIVNKAWEGKNLSSQEYLHFNAMLKDHLGRKAWSWCMNLKRTQGIFYIENKGYSQISELMVAVLNECERSEDVIIAKNCIILSQTFYKKDDQKKDYLQTSILNHSLWTNIDFWKKIINSAIAEEIKNQENSDIQPDQLKSLTYCQLVSFGHIMMSFKIDESTITAITEEIAKSYSFFPDEIQGIMVINMQESIAESSFE